jgi:hypothetical protein
MPASELQKNGCFSEAVWYNRPATESKPASPLGFFVGIVPTPAIPGLLKIN